MERRDGRRGACRVVGSKRRSLREGKASSPGKSVQRDLLRRGLGALFQSGQERLVLRE